MKQKTGFITVSNEVHQASSRAPVWKLRTIDKCFTATVLKFIHSRDKLLITGLTEKSLSTSLLLAGCVGFIARTCEAFRLASRVIETSQVIKVI